MSLLKKFWISSDGIILPWLTLASNMELSPSLKPFMPIITAPGSNLASALNYPDGLQHTIGGVADDHHRPPGNRIRRAHLCHRQYCRTANISLLCPLKPPWLNLNIKWKLRTGWPPPPYGLLFVQSVCSPRGLPGCLSPSSGNNKLSL